MSFSDLVGMNSNMSKGSRKTVCTECDMKRSICLLFPLYEVLSMFQLCKQFLEQDQARAKKKRVFCGCCERNFKDYTV